VQYRVDMLLCEAIDTSAASGMPETKLLFVLSVGNKDILRNACERLSRQEDKSILRP
jgi:hypothetical protein